MKAAYTVLGFCLLLGAWQLAAASGAFSPALLPGPERVASSFRRLTLSGELPRDVGYTLRRWALGFAIGVAAGIPAGLLMGHYDPVRRTLAFAVDAARSLPVVALMPVFLVFFGVGDAAKVAATAWAAGLAVVLNTMYGAGRTKEQWVLAAKSLGATPGQIFWKVVVPASLPELFVGLRIAVSHALVVVIAAEMMLGGETDGLGRKLIDSAMLFRTADMYAFLAAAGLLGYASNLIFLRIERWCLPWIRE